MQFACALNPKWPHRRFHIVDTSTFLDFFSLECARREREAAGTSILTLTPREVSRTHTVLYAQRAHILSRTARFTEHAPVLLRFTIRPCICKMFVKAVIC